MSFLIKIAKEEEKGRARDQEDPRANGAPAGIADCAVCGQPATCTAGHVLEGHTEAVFCRLRAARPSARGRQGRRLRSFGESFVAPSGCLRHRRTSSRCPMIPIGRKPRLDPRHHRDGMTNHRRGACAYRTPVLGWLPNTCWFHTTHQMGRGARRRLLDRGVPGTWEAIFPNWK